MKPHSTFSELLQAFFTDRLLGQCNASPLTIANYRDTFCLLIAFAQRCLKKPPTKLAVEDLDAPFIVRFLDYLERERGNSPRSRNVRLAAIHSFFTYVALQEPALGAVAQRVLAIQSKRFAKKTVDFLTRAESDALLAAPDQTTWSGRRDRTLLLVALQTGLRVSELIGLRCQDVVLEAGAHVRCTGKGRKTRCIPLRKEVVAALRRWLRERNGQTTEPFSQTLVVSPSAAMASNTSWPTHENGTSEVPVIEDQTCFPSCAATQHRHEPPAKRCGSLSHRVVAGTRIHGHHANLPSCQSRTQREGTGQNRAIPSPPGRYRPPDQLLAFLQAL